MSGSNGSEVRSGHKAQDVHPKNKIAKYFTSKMNLFKNSRGIAMGNKQTMANHRQVPNDQGKVRSY